jgi:hypothetical protein
MLMPVSNARLDSGNELLQDSQLISRRGRGRNSVRRKDPAVHEILGFGIAQRIIVRELWVWVQLQTLPAKPVNLILPLRR